MMKPGRTYSWISPFTSPDNSSFPLILFFGFFPNLKCEVQLLQVGLSAFIGMKLQKSPISLVMKCLMVSPIMVLSKEMKAISTGNISPSNLSGCV